MTHSGSIGRQAGQGGASQGLILRKAWPHQRSEMIAASGCIESKTLPMNISRNIYLCDFKHGLINRSGYSLLERGKKFDFERSMIGQDPGK